ncbi:TPA: hypothetical protein ACGW5B_005503 [Bacillus paranthracis]|nr:hypothetical protein BCK_27418 [Bacillus cereus FRI-35]
MSETKATRPKQKQLRMRKKENPLFVEWLDNQTDFSDSVRKLIELHINRHGTKDLNDPSVVFSMAREMVLLSPEGSSISNVVQAVPTQTTSIPVAQEVPVAEEKKEEVKEEIQAIEKVEETIEEVKKEETEEAPKKVKRRGASASNF